METELFYFFLSCLMPALVWESDQFTKDSGGVNFIFSRIVVIKNSRRQADMQHDVCYSDPLSANQQVSTAVTLKR